MELEHAGWPSVCVGGHSQFRTEREVAEEKGRPWPAHPHYYIPKKPRILNLNIAVCYEGIFVRLMGKTCFI